MHGKNLPNFCADQSEWRQNRVRGDHQAHFTARKYDLGIEHGRYLSNRLHGRKIRDARLLSRHRMQIHNEGLRRPAKRLRSAWNGVCFPKSWTFLSARSPNPRPISFRYLEAHLPQTLLTSWLFLCLRKFLKIRIIH